MGKRVTMAARARGLIIRPLGDVIVLMPPLSTTAEELDWLVGVVEECIRGVTQS